MTTATRPRKLRIYTVDLSDAIVPNVVGDAVGLRLGRIQAPYYVAAPTKAAAARHLEAAGFFHASPRTLRVAMGHPLMAALDAGFLAEEGEIVAWAENNGGGDRPVVRIAPGTRVPVRVGRWEYMVFRGSDGTRVDGQFLVRESDDALFPPRWDSKPATPATGWTVEMGRQAR